MLKSVLLRARVFAARRCIDFLAKSGLFDGYFAPWRGSLFDYAQDRELHILPVHYYTPIPDIRGQQVNNDAPRYLGADEPTLDAAMATLSDLRATYAEAFDEIAARPAEPAFTPTRFAFGPAPYSTVEAEALYGLIRARKPTRIVEIGCGHTTFLIAEAIAQEQGYTPEYTCIEPYRPPYLATLPAEVTSFVDDKLQSVDLSFFETLEAGDILFIDSSHVVKYDSDTVYELLEILPRLKPGVLVHVHDIFLPYEYPPDWLEEARFFWAEQYMLDALIRDGGRYKILLPFYQLYRERNADLKALFPLVGGGGQRPGAFWIEIA